MFELVNICILSINYWNLRSVTTYDPQYLLLKIFRQLKSRGSSKYLRHSLSIATIISVRMLSSVWILQYRMASCHWSRSVLIINSLIFYYARDARSMVMMMEFIHRGLKLLNVVISQYFPVSITTVLSLMSFTRMQVIIIEVITLGWRQNTSIKAFKLKVWLQQIFVHLVIEFSFNFLRELLVC